MPAGPPSRLPDPFNLDRFAAAQATTIATALAELRAGRKQGHWMWFIFPQLAGLGHSAMSQLYGIASLDEARAYLGHPLLGPRLQRSTEAALASSGRTVAEIFGSPDDLKFRSSMTLFETVAPDGGVFALALDRLCDGTRDERTLRMLREAT